MGFTAKISDGHYGVLVEFSTSCESLFQKVIYSDRQYCQFFNYCAVIPFIATATSVLKLAICIFHTLEHLSIYAFTKNKGHLGNSVKGIAECLRSLIEAVPLIGNLFAICLLSKASKEALALSFLIHTHAYIPPTKWEMLHAEGGKARVVQEIQTMTLDKKEELQEALMFSAKMGCLKAVSFLINKGMDLAFVDQTGANPNLPESEKNTPLHIACMRRDIRMVQLLLQHNADSTCYNKDHKRLQDLLEMSFQETSKTLQKKSNTCAL